MTPMGHTQPSHLPTPLHVSPVFKVCLIGDAHRIRGASGQSKIKRLQSAHSPALNSPGKEA